jgi:hypothetical protein
MPALQKLKTPRFLLTRGPATHQLRAGRRNSLKELQGPEIVQVNNARHSPCAIEYDH